MELINTEESMEAAGFNRGLLGQTVTIRLETIGGEFMLSDSGTLETYLISQEMFGYRFKGDTEVSQYRLNTYRVSIVGSTPLGF